MAEVQTVIAARPGVVREALQAMLAVLPQIEVTGTAGGGLSALNLARSQPPALLVIDPSLPEDEILALLRQIKQEQPGTRCLVLTETSRQQQTMLASGADAALMRGEPVQQFAEAIKKMGL